MGEQQGVDNVWRCGNGHSCQQPVWRYMCKVQVSDHSDSMEVGMFDEVAKKLFECEAGEYVQMFENQGNDAQLSVVKNRILWQKLSLRLRSKKEVWQDTERVGSTVEQVSPVSFVQEGKQMFADIQASLNQLGPTFEGQQTC